MSSSGPGPEGKWHRNPSASQSFVRAVEPPQKRELGFQSEICSSTSQKDWDTYIQWFSMYSSLLDAQETNSLTSLTSLTFWIPTIFFRELSDLIMPKNRPIAPNNRPIAGARHGRNVERPMVAGNLAAIMGIIPCCAEQFKLKQPLHNVHS